MTIISSQQYINWEIVGAKKTELDGVSEIVLPCCYIGEIDGTEMAYLADGHHRLVAARKLDIAVRFDITEDPEGLTGVDALEARWMDGDWYNVETSDPEICYFDLIF